MNPYILAATMMLLNLNEAGMIAFAVLYTVIKTVQLIITEFVLY